MELKKPSYYKLIFENKQEIVLQSDKDVKSVLKTFDGRFIPLEQFELISKKSKDVGGPTYVNGSTLFSIQLVDVKGLGNQARVWRLIL